MIPAISDPESLTSASASSSSSSSGSAGEPDSALDLLGDRCCRAILQYLEDRESDAPVSLSDLADHVTLTEAGQASGALASCGDALLGSRRRVRISLRHHHVPKLAASNAIDFDPETNTVALRETGSELLARATAVERAATAREPTSQ